jgi:integration host factor subunit beta
MTKSELIARLMQTNELDQRGVASVVDAVFDEITAALRRGDRVELRGFGALGVKRRAPGIGRNPKTGEAINLSEKYYAYFRAGKEMRRRLNPVSGEALPGRAKRARSLKQTPQGYDAR